jgi:DNA anti-recombination protein RmuC
MQGAIDMTRVFAAILAVCMAVVWTGGCQEEQVSSDVKQSRLIAAENGDLNRQLQQEAKKRNEEIKNLNSQMQTEAKKRDDEIKNLKAQFQTEKEKLNADVDNLSKQLAECVQERQAALDNTEEGIKKRSGELTEEMVAPLLTEIGQLKEKLSNCERKK